MNTIKQIFKATQTINKSIFIGQLFPIKDAQDVINYLQKTKKNYYDATHNCYAYIYGESGEYQKFSDDGEPSQTAGIVILDVLKKNDLTNVLCIITRYFGGIKLGAGGLVRAYSSTTALVLKEAEIFKIIKTKSFELVCSYQNYNLILKSLTAYNAKELTKEFSDIIKLTYEINIDDFDDLYKELIDVTKNQLQIKVF